MNTSDIIIITICVLAAIIAGLYFYNKKNMRKVVDAQDFIKHNKMVVPVFIIDKKFEKPTEKNLPRNIYEKLPKRTRLRKMPIVKAKVGPQITTLMCDKNVYEVLIPKKTTKLEISGIYIVSIPGMDLANKKNKTWRQKLSVYINEYRK